MAPMEPIVGKYFAKLVGPFSLHLANRETYMVVEMQQLEAWRRPSARREDAPSVSGVLATDAARRAWQHRWVGGARWWQPGTLIEQSWLPQSKATLRWIQNSLATTSGTNDQLQLRTHRRMQNMLAATAWASHREFAPPV